MKELSIEEKANRYDKVVNKLRYFMAQGVDPLITRADVQDFFPELAESEDERMWKLIKKYAHCNISDMALNADHITREQLESWLEKQCEQKPAEDRYMEGYLNGINDASKTLKPADWSEEDKRKIDKIYSILRQAADTHAFSTTCRLIGDKECIELQDFLKSLKDRVHPKQEWSEEDKRIKDNLISQLGNLFARKLIKEETKDKYVNWLKSLRPQSQLKPSDEQMEYLAKAITTLGDEGNCKTASILNDLRVGLKKLREE